MHQSINQSFMTPCALISSDRLHDLISSFITPVKAKVKKTYSEFAIILGGLTTELQLLDNGINRPFKAKLRVAWEHWMTDEHTFAKTWRQ